MSTSTRAPSRPISSAGSTTWTRVETLVHVEPALETGDRHALEGAQQQPTRVPGRRCGRPARQLRERDRRPGRRRGRRAHRGRSRAPARPAARRSVRARTARSSSSRRGRRDAGPGTLIGLCGMPPDTTNARRDPSDLTSRLDVISAAMWSSLAPPGKTDSGACDTAAAMAVVHHLGPDHGWHPSTTPEPIVDDRWMDVGSWCAPDMRGPRSSATGVRGRAGVGQAARRADLTMMVWAYRS